MILSYINERLVRRVDYQETRDGQVATHFRFVYDNFLCVQRLDAANDNAVRTEFVWDPTEPIATRPLVFQPASGETAYYFHDGNKNVSEVFYYALGNGIAAHYDYAPFGAVIRTAKSTSVVRDILSENPFRFSSEVHDNALGLVYYNYRHYNPKDGRWQCVDPIYSNTNEYLFTQNGPLLHVDRLGLITVPWTEPSSVDMPVSFPGAFSSVEDVPACCGDNEYNLRTQCCRLGKKTIEDKYRLCIYVIHQGKRSCGHAWVEVTNLVTGARTSFGQRRSNHVNPDWQHTHVQGGLYMNYEIQQFQDRTEGDPGIVKKCTTICGFKPPVPRDYTLLGGGNCADVAEEIWFEQTGERLTAPSFFPRRPSLLKNAIQACPSGEGSGGPTFWL